MGWDIVTIGHHKLDTSNIGILAQQLSNLLNINIEYGYYDYLVYNRKRNRLEIGKGDFLPLGKVVRNSGSPQWYQLFDRYYGHKQILKLLGPKVKTVKCQFDDFSMRKECSCIKVSYNIWCPDKENQPFFFDIDIYKEICSLYLSDEPFRWFGLIDYFASRNYTACRLPDFCRECNSTGTCSFAQSFIGKPSLKELQKYRRELRDAYKTLGAEKIYYFSDQGPTEFILGRQEYSWASVERYIQNKKYCNKTALKDFPGALEDAFLISIPDFFKSSNPKFIDHGIGVFVDDFSDL